MNLSALLMGWKTSRHFIFYVTSLIYLRMRTFSNPILSVEEYEGARASASALLRFTLASSRFTVTPRFVYSHEQFFFLYCLILYVCLFLIFQFFICVVHIRPELWPACRDCISPTFNPSIHLSIHPTYAHLLQIFGNI
jgi:hypothetical protein